MRVLIDVDAAPGGWTVRYLDSSAQLLLNDAGIPLIRNLPRLGTGKRAFPLPPATELPVRGRGATLCQATQPGQLQAVLNRFIGRSPNVQDNEVEAFGNYLFHTLLGEPVWNLLQSQATDGVLELSLRWLTTDECVPLNRLPWEAMHGPNKFLAEETRPTVVFVRRIANSPHSLVDIAAPPRVLFVIGTDLTQDAIRSGAEYWALLQALENAGLNFQLVTYLVLDASEEKLKEAIRAFRPNVVHFIGHGGCTSDGTCFLELKHEKHAAPHQVSGPSLAVMLTPDPHIALPQIVVLNACHSGSVSEIEDSGRIATPLAVDLITRGVPIVVGIAGEIADQACRLFTRLFYEALLRGGHVTLAAAEGRRAGILAKSGVDPRKSVDWSLPTIFLSDGINDPRLTTLDTTLAEIRHKRAANYASSEDYPIFCDRLQFMHWYTMLIAERQNQAILSPRRRSFQSLVIRGTPSTNDGLFEEDKYGRSRLLHCLAVQAVRDGHVVCLVNGEVLKAGVPKDISKFLGRIKFALNTTADRYFVANWQCKNLNGLLATSMGAELGEWASPNLQRLYDKDPNDPPLLALALCEDLLALRSAVCESLPEADRSRIKLLLIWDDIHLLESRTLSFLLDDILGNTGFQYGPATEHLRAIISYDATSTPERRPALSVIERRVGGTPFEEVTLEPFPAPPDSVEDILAYKQFLLNFREGNERNGNPKPLTLASNAPKGEANHFFRNIRTRVKGIPSRLRSAEVRIYIDEILKHWPEDFDRELLSSANDTDALLIARQQMTGGNHE